MRLIAIVLPTFGLGGAERVSLTLATELLRRGHSVELVVMSAKGPLLERVPSKARVVDLGAARLRNVPWKLRRYLKDTRPDGVVANIWPLTLLVALAARISGSGLPVVACHQNNLSSQYIGERGYHPAVMAAALKLERALCRAMVGCSAGVSSDLETLGRLSRSSVVVVPNPVNIPVDVPKSELDEAERHWPVGRGGRIVAVGNFKKQKNFPLLLRAFARIANSPGRHLIIVGDGDERGQLEEQVKELGLLGKVGLPGRSHFVEAYYRTADLYVLSSDYEGLPTVLIEALGSGLPVVSTDCPSGPREILDGGRFGRLVPCGDTDALADAMSCALATEWNTDSLRHRARDFSPERAADRYLDLLFGGTTRRAT